MIISPLKIASHSAKSFTGFSRNAGMSRSAGLRIAAAAMVLSAGSAASAAGEPAESSSAAPFPPAFDLGYEDGIRDLADVHGDGQADYCRVVGRRAAPVLSCSPAGDKGFESHSPYSSAPGFDLGYSSHIQAFADVNGDGRKDYCRVVGPPHEKFLSCALGSKFGFGKEYGFSSARGIDLGYSDEVQTFADVNGDGRDDYCRVAGPSHNRALSCILAEKHGFGQEYGFNSRVGIDLGYSHEPRTFVDANGDGYADYCRVVGRSHEKFISCALAGPHGFDTRHELSYRSQKGVDLGYADEMQAFADVNGDRYADYCRVVGPPKDRFVSCMLGGQFGFGEQYGFNSARGIDLGGLPLARNLADVNGDGYADYCRMLRDRAGEYLSCSLATRTGFSSHARFESP